MIIQWSVVIYILAAKSTCALKMSLVLPFTMTHTHGWHLWKKLHRTILLLPVVHVRDCRRPVAKDPGLDVHGSGFWVSYRHIYYPLQAFAACGVKR